MEQEPKGHVQPERGMARTPGKVDHEPAESSKFFDRPLAVLLRDKNYVRWARLEMEYFYAIGAAGYEQVHGPSSTVPFPTWLERLIEASKTSGALRHFLPEEELRAVLADYQLHPDALSKKQG